MAAELSPPHDLLCPARGCPQAVGSTTPGSGLAIERTVLRGVDSEGMLCSAYDIGWAPEPDGVLVQLPPGLQPGQACPQEPPEVRTAADAACLFWSLRVVRSLLCVLLGRTSARPHALHGMRQACCAEHAVLCCDALCCRVLCLARKRPSPSRTRKEGGASTRPLQVSGLLGGVPFPPLELPPRWQLEATGPACCALPPPSC